MTTKPTDSTAKPEECARIGNALTALGREIGLTDEEAEYFNQLRDKAPAEPLDFGNNEVQQAVSLEGKRPAITPC